MQQERVTKPVGGGTESFLLATRLGDECHGVHVLQGGYRSLIYAIGWGTDTNLHSSTMGALASAGYDVWSLDPPRIGGLEPITDFQMPAVEVHKAAGVVSLLEKLSEEGISETDIVVHSEGAIYATIAALLAAEDPKAAKVRSIIYVEPAGFVGKVHPMVLSSVFALQGAENVLKDPGYYIANRRSAKGMLNIRMLPQEAAAIAQTDLSPLLRQLHTKYGVKIGVMSGQHDTVFPASRIEQTLRELGIPYEYKTLPIRHNGMYMQSQLIADEVPAMFERLHGLEAA